VFLDFYVAALSNPGFGICGSYIQQVWSPLLFKIISVWFFAGKVLLINNAFSVFVHLQYCLHVMYHLTTTLQCVASNRF